jgi:cytoskeleton protein RodZ
MADRQQSDAVPEAAAAPAETLGERLRRTRLTSDLTLEQLSTELRIEAKHLAALEEERFEEIGVPVFVKGYLKQYSLRLGLDPADTLALYHKQTTLPEVQLQPSRTIKLRDERQITAWVLAAIVLLVVIAGLAVWWWNGGTFSELPSLPGTRVVAPEPAAEPSSAPPPAPAAALPSFAAPAASETAEPAAEPAEAATTDEPPVEVPEPAAEDSAASAAAGVDAAIATLTIPLVFSFAAESWAEVTDARGERLLFGLNAAGRTVTVRGEPPFAVVLGNADSVALTVDGEPYQIPRTGRQGNLARFAVDIAEE